jgi:SAM-dependent methyltransferase
MHTTNQREPCADDDAPALREHSLPTHADCPLCQQKDAPMVFFNHDRAYGLPGRFGLYRCFSCEAIFIQPWLDDSQLAKYYPNDYSRYRYSRSLDKKNYRGWQRFVLVNHYGYPAASGYSPSTGKKALAFLLSFVTAKKVIPYRGEGKILDVGCGGGSYLYRLKQWGWETYGVEPSEAGAKQARSLGLAVTHGMLLDANFPSGFFDVVYLSHVLEHLRDPYSTFREIKRILKPDGLVYLTVPNTRSLSFLVFRKNWYALDTPRHVVSYSPKTLQFLCAKTGFKIVSLDYTAGPFSFVRSVKYFLEEGGDHWPGWLRRINWPNNKIIRRVLKPAFICIDLIGFGDFLNAILKNLM